VNIRDNIRDALFAISLWRKKVLLSGGLLNCLWFYRIWFLLSCSCRS